MAKKKTARKAKAMPQAEMCCGSSMYWGPRQWFLALLSEAACYFFLYFALMYLGVAYAWVPALVLLVFGNLAYFFCPFSGSCK